MTQLRMAVTVAMARWWWAYILRGIVAIVAGVLAFVLPGLAVLTLVTLFGLWALLEGATAFLTGLRTRDRNRTWWVEVLEGVVSIVAGVLALVFPLLIADALRILIAVWAILIGVFQVYLAIRLRDEIRGEFWLGLAGAAAIVFGVSMFLYPVASVVSLVWLIGSFGIAFGVLLVMLGWRLRGINELAKRDAATDYSRP
jgi:uncharacterized membrane protein HdeD (DUF308 family)